MIKNDLKVLCFEWNDNSTKYAMALDQGRARSLELVMVNRSLEIETPVFRRLEDHALYRFRCGENLDNSLLREEPRSRRPDSLDLSAGKSKIVASFRL